MRPQSSSTTCYPSIVNIARILIAAKDFSNCTARCVIERNRGRVHVMPFDLFECELHERWNVAEIRCKKFIEDSIQNRHSVVTSRFGPVRGGRKRESRCRLASHVDNGKLAARPERTGELEPRNPHFADWKLRSNALPVQPLVKMVKHTRGQIGV